jgi:hypothetical protein
MGLLNNALPFSLISPGARDISMQGWPPSSTRRPPSSQWLAGHALTSDEWLSARKSFGITIGFAGVVAMIGPKALGG